MPRSFGLTGLSFVTYLTNRHKKPCLSNVVKRFGGAQEILLSGLPVRYMPVLPQHVRKENLVIQ